MQEFALEENAVKTLGQLVNFFFLSRVCYLFKIIVYMAALAENACFWCF